MKKFALGFVVLLAAVFASAQAVAPGGGSSSSGGSGGGIDGGYVSATTATATFYVDPTGSDVNACTSTGTGACATLGGVFAKQPRSIQHALTINVAAGTYTEATGLADVDVNAAITITGPALANVTPTTGTATGTVTAVSNTAPATITDSGQSWTANDLIGHFLVMTSGTQNAQVRVIAKNTATVLTLASPFSSAPATSDTYAIRSPGAVITSASAVPLVLRLVGSAGSVGAASSTGPTIGITGLDFKATGTGGTGCVVSSTNHNVTFTNSRCLSTGASGTGLSFRGGGLTSSNLVAKGAVTGLNFAMTGVNVGALSASTFSPNGGFFYGDSLAGISWASSVGGTALTGSTGWTAESNTGVAALISGEIARRSTGAGVAVFRCLNGASTAAIRQSSAQVTGADYSPAATFMWENVFLEGCATGIDLSSLSAGNGLVFVPSSSGALSCAGVPTCIAVANGSRVHVPTTFSTDAGTDIVIDGATYTKANLTGASPTRLPALAPGLSGSTVWQ